LDAAFAWDCWAVASAARPVTRPVPTKAAAVRPPVSTAKALSAISREAVSRDIEVLQYQGLRIRVIGESGVSRVRPLTARWHQVGVKKASRPYRRLDLDLRFSRGAHKARRVTITSGTLSWEPSLRDPGASHEPS
jgi:hypothetical protein